MKCPKCGYNSFEFLNACKKCGTELSSFKKIHRINTVLRPAAAVSAELPQQDPTAAAVAQATVQAENLHESFDLGFPETSQDDVTDQAFNGFSFSDESAPPAENSAPKADETTMADFSFGEPEEEEPQPASWDIQFDEDGSELDKYERILDPEHINSGNGQTGTEALNETDELGSFGTSDFDFAPESSQEDIFGMEKELDAPTAAEKKPQPNLEDFDKEFEMIFSDDDSTESGEKTS
ncbi:MAG: hypothetical protein WCA04_06640 [Geobacteraceae bacterium]